MERVVFYARTSTEEERQCKALDTQIMELRELILKTHGWELVDEYIDQSSGTTIKGRVEFNRMIVDMASEKFDIIVIKDQDRLMRDEYTWYMFRNRLLEYQKRLFIKMEGRFYIPETDGLITGIKAIIAAQYSRDLSRKLNNAHKTRMKKGTVVTNGKMWGYEQKDGKLYINEKEAEIIQYIFDAYASGKGFRSILKELVDKGIKNRNGADFSITTLKRIIRQEKYKGTLVCGRKHLNFDTKRYDVMPEEDWIIHENGVPAIVSEELWEKANSMLVDKVKKNFDGKEEIVGYFSGTYPLSGKIKCGKCGKTYYHNTIKQKRKDGGVYSWEQWDCASFKLFGKKHEKGCDNITVRDKHLTKEIINVINKVWQNREEYIKEILKTLELTVVEKEDINSYIEYIQNDIEKLKLKKDKLLELYTEGLISKSEWKQKNDELSNQIDTLQFQLDEKIQSQIEAVSAEERLTQISDFFDHWEANLDEINDSIIRELVHEVIVNPDGTFGITLKVELGKMYPNVSTCRQD